MSSGFEQAIDALYEVAGNAESRAAVGRALAAGAVPVRDKMIDNLMANKSVRTGTLVGAIRIGRLTSNVHSGRRYGYRMKVGVIGSSAPHAHLVEYGHGGPKPAPEHPFMTPAYEAAKDEATRIIAQKLREAIFEHNGEFTLDIWGGDE